MGCGASQSNVAERPGQGKLTVWGDYFNSETRTIIAILNIAGVPFTIQEVDLFKGEHKQASYLA